MELLAYDQNGKSKDILQEDNIATNIIQEFELNYSKENIQGTEFYRIVDIDIKPDSEQNTINLGSNGVVPVAIFGSVTFEVAQVNPATIKLANSSVKLKGNGQPIANYSDINGDGFTDIIVHVLTDVLQLTETDEKAELNGFLFDGRNIKGYDSIRVVP